MNNIPGSVAIHLGYAKVARQKKKNVDLSLHQPITPTDLLAGYKRCTLFAFALGYEDFPVIGCHFIAGQEGG